jgi:hypothetical protein
MSQTTRRRLLGGRRLAVAVAGAALAAGATLPSGGAVGTTATSDGDPLAAMEGRYSVVRSGLDNPRQIQLLRSGRLLVAEAGHGASSPDGCSEQGCVGNTGQVTLLTGRASRAVPVIDGLLSLAGPDGTFATGADGASKRPGGPYVAIIGEGPGRQGARLVARGPRGGVRVIADIGRYEARHNPDGEIVESNPYSVLALKHRYLVADAAGDAILDVRPSGRIRTWAVLPEYGRRVDAVPTSISLGEDGRIYVGELHSEQRRKAHVLQYDLAGNLQRRFRGFTTVTGVDRGADGALYVSELFGGTCGFDDIPTCFPGRVVKVWPNGRRTSLPVPFPAGIAVDRKRVLVSAFSVSPGAGFAGNPDWSGAIWRLRF